MNNKNELQIIDERELLGKQFRIYGDIESPLFLAKDIAEWIEHNKPSEMIRNVDEDEKVSDSIATLGGVQTAWFLTEDGLYEVLMQSRKPIAKQFKKQVKEILKSIRKHGAYMTDYALEQAVSNPDFMIGLLTELKEEQKQRKLLQEENKKLVVKIEEDKPKIEYIDTILNSKNTMTITQIAKDYDLSGMKLNKILHGEGIQYKCGDQWLLYAKYVGNGYTKSSTFVDGFGGARVNTKWSQKGRLMIHELLTKLGYIAIMDRMQKQ